MMRPLYIPSPRRRVNVARAAATAIGAAVMVAVMVGFWIITPA